MNTLTANIDPRAFEIGVRFGIATIAGCTVERRSKPVAKHCRAIRREIGKIDIDDDARLAAYRDSLAAVGAGNAMSSPEWLAKIFETNGKPPSINSLIDIYNHVSLKHRCVLSAHDADKLTGEVRLEVLDIPRPFEPIGLPDELIPTGEWGVTDDEHMLCRLNCKQSRRSSITAGTENVLIYAQGNPLLEGDALRTVLQEVCDHIIRFCGGEISGMAGEGIPS